jgi:isocitrate lyase
MMENKQYVKVEKEQAGWFRLKKCMQQAVEVVVPTKLNKDQIWMNDHIRAGTFCKNTKSINRSRKSINRD